MGVRGRFFRNAKGDTYQVIEMLKNGSITFARTLTPFGEKISYGLGDIFEDMEVPLD